MFGLILDIQVTPIFQSCRDGSSWVEPVLFAADKRPSCSRAQHSDSAGGETQSSNPIALPTEPLRSTMIRYQPYNIFWHVN